MEICQKYALQGTLSIIETVRNNGLTANLGHLLVNGMEKMIRLNQCPTLDSFMTNLALHNNLWSEETVVRRQDHLLHSLHRLDSNVGLVLTGSSNVTTVAIKKQVFLTKKMKR